MMQNISRNTYRFCIPREFRKTPFSWKPAWSFNYATLEAAVLIPHIPSSWKIDIGLMIWSLNEYYNNRKLKGRRKKYPLPRI